MNKIFYKLDDLISVPVSTEYQEEGKWQAMSYEAQGEKGVGLVAGEYVEPSPIELNLNVKGWHRVYIALGSFGGSCVGISLSGEAGKTVIAPTNISYCGDVWNWGGYGFAEESFFKAVDLTDQKIVLEKTAIRSSAVVLYIRIEEMTQKEIDEYRTSGQNKRIMYHFDTDYFYELDYKDPKDYLGRLKMLENGNGDIFIQEKLAETANCNNEKLPWKKGPDPKLIRKYLDKSGAFNVLMAEETHKMGIKIYAGYRVQQGDFHMPFALFFYNNSVQKQFPQFRCLTRDGRPIEALSFAFPEVRKIAINSIIKALPKEWDGVSIFFHRGVVVSLEQPVIDEVEKRYGVDARRLPRSDERLHSVLCEFVTSFMRELKAALNKKAQEENRANYEINIITFHDVKSSKYFGYDVEAFLKEGLVNSVSQGIMMYYEDIDDCLASDGLIDIEKYKKKKSSSFVIKRWFDDDGDHIISGVKEYLELQKKYGGEFYAALGWENKDYPYQLELAKAIYEAGAEKMISWNGNHQAKYCSKLWGIKACGDKELIEKGGASITSKSFRLSSINGIDISEFDPNWRG